MAILNMQTLYPKVKITDAQFHRLYSRIKRSIQLGEGIEQIGNDVGISPTTIQNMLARNGTSVTELRAARPEWRRKTRKK